jgi:hypothetical protein
MMSEHRYFAREAADAFEHGRRELAAMLSE